MKDSATDAGRLKRIYLWLFISNYAEKKFMAGIISKLLDYRVGFYLWARAPHIIFKNSTKTLYIVVRY